MPAPPAVFQGIGVPELLIVLGIVLVIFGPKRLPLLGRQLGSGMREFKEGITRRSGGDEEDARRTQDAAQEALGRSDEPVSGEPVQGEVVAARDR